MGYSTHTTEWPSCGILPDTKKHVIDALFSLLDDDSENVGNRLADEVFSSDAVLMSSAGIAQGSEAIRNSRKEAWKVIKCRRHEVIRVYVHDEALSDLQVVGHVTMGLLKEKEVKSDFIARILFDEQHPGSPKIRSYTVLADSAPIKEAIQEALA